MKQKTGYKVITVERESAIMTISKKYYLNGIEVRPNKHYGPLCVFAKRTDAKQFMSHYGYLRLIIVKCKYTPSKEQRVWRPYKLNPFDMSLPISFCPVGTVLAESVTCLE